MLRVIKLTLKAGERAVYGVSQRRILNAAIKSLEPWYQPIKFGYGISTKAVDKGGNRITYRSIDRGIKKWKRFIQPSLPFDLKNKRVLEVGCNAGLFLAECVRDGAREAVGIEKDDHYFSQARFVARTFSQLEDRYYPVRVYQGAMESFPYDRLGRFDLAMFLASIYHIGKSEDYAAQSREDIFSLQVETVRSVAKIADYCLFQGNSQQDEGRGKGKGSLLELVEAAGLEVVEELDYGHRRGYVLLTRFPGEKAVEYCALDRMVNKLNLPAGMSAERELVDDYLDANERGERFSVEDSRYYRLRTAQDDWLAEGVARLPSDLDVAPAYWVVPWASKPKPQSKGETDIRRRHFAGLYSKFCTLIEEVLANGYDEGEAIPGYMLVHPEYGEVFQYIDGNHRIGLLSSLHARGGLQNDQVQVEVRQRIERDILLQYPLTRQLVEDGYFSERDVYRWFDTAFWHLQEHGD